MQAEDREGFLEVYASPDKDGLESVGQQLQPQLSYILGFCCSDCNVQGPLGHHRRN